MAKTATFIIFLALTALMLSACGDVINEKLPTDTGDNAAIAESNDNPDETEDEEIPQGYAFHIFDGTVGHLEDNGDVSFENQDLSVGFGFILPEDWSYYLNTADVGDVKVFEIGGCFNTEEFSADKVRLTPEGTEFPAAITNDAGRTVTIYAEETSDAGVYDYMRHTSSVRDSGEINEKYVYIVSRGGYSVYVIFFENDYYSDEICETVLNSFDKKFIVIEERG